MRAILVGSGILLLGWSDAVSQTPAVSPVAAAIEKYVLETEYPEEFDDVLYRVRAENLVIADIDGDGRQEAIAHYIPHYRQSPTIVIYQVARDMTVTRVKEGLAPGPLQPLTGDYLDSHTIGNGVDMSIGGQQEGDQASHLRMVDSILDQFGSVVEYADFFHVDNRKGIGTYVDMTGVKQPEAKTCESFEFSEVDGISVGIVRSVGDAVLLAAWVNDKVYLYRIKALNSDGMIDKEMWTVDTAADFKGFPEGPRRELEYLTTSGGVKPFAVSCSGHECEQVGS